ncbi:unnamed protein product [Rotaria sp. Silwood2]|nr:unnamed protein product [Rotaria sp. Silwood2]CAF3870844.1 unnamed protein product [Rotaria sp. Silwood2]
MYTDWLHFRLNAEFWRDFCTHHFLPFANRSRWFSGKGRCPHSATVQHILEWLTHPSYLLIIRVDYEDEKETYFLPVSLLATKAQDVPGNALITEIALSDGKDFTLVDAIYDESFRRALFQHFNIGKSDKSLSTIHFKDIDEPYRLSQILSTDSTNSLIVFNDKYLFKLYRKLSTDMNREIEMLTFIGQQCEFSNHIPTCFGAMVWLKDPGSNIALIFVQDFVSNARDCWSIVTSLTDGPLSPQFLVEKAALLGRRTAEMHLVLHKPHCSDTDFVSEIFTKEYCRFITGRLIERLERCYAALETCPSSWAKTILKAKALLLHFITTFESRSFQSYRIQVHGDFHLGQVLFNTKTGDYTIIDFEGEQSNNVFERRLKHSPWKDVTSMIRSFHYAATLTHNRWYESVCDAFLQSFLKHTSELWVDKCECNDLFLFHLLERTVHELAYEMHYRPQWINIPLCGLVEVIHKIETRQQTSTLLVESNS